MSSPITRVEIVQNNLENYLTTAAPAHRRLDETDPLRPGGSLTARQALEVFEDQVTSRLLDVAARELKKRNQGFYTISSAGHENNAIIGTLLRLDDPCFLHYRSGALMAARSRKLPGVDPVFDTLLSFCASADDPISQGRHKVWGSRAMWVPPQTSTIASHLPKAAGLAFALKTARRTAAARDFSDDSIVLCSFGDASANHATALAGFNAARYAVRRGGAAPILFLCEDNGIGISVSTPRNWIHDSFSNQLYLKYFEAAGDIDEIWDVTQEAVNACRRSRAPVFLHLHVARLWGHAGTDVETTYRTVEEISAEEAKDPLLLNAKRLVETGAASPGDLRAIFSRVQSRIDELMDEAARRPKLGAAEQVVEPLAPYDESACRALADHVATPEAREKLFEGALPEHAKAPTKRTMAAHINSALADEMLRFPEIIVFGEDVAKKGGVYYVTQGLQKKFGVARVFDTLLDETTILGTAQGAAMAGLLPIPEIQYLAYIHNALDQIRGEACSLSFFSSGQFTNPMVVRVQGLAYQKGFGGHFHNDNSIGGLRDIPGLLLATPARGDDAVKMLRGLIATARECGRVALFLEPIALYHEKDLYEDGDGAWLFDYPQPGKMLLPGEVGVYNPEARDLLIVSYANGLRLSLRAARKLNDEFGLAARVIDVRWLNPLPFEAIRRHADECGRLLVADECRATGGGIAEALIANLAENGFKGAMRSVRAVDSYVPLGAAANLVLISEEQIVEAGRDVAGHP
ncbi:MAG TPA: thiamine pyrophosphate-dependent enzyme [Blastocatellia bacterium]|jgi:2-oxoisovalerate dehydrogenase E1 component|nr:thiamine pyrophosphate-dependent enzyme [Blastocatellia bacterium]